MTAIIAKNDYSSKATAVRGAKRAGLNADDFTVEQFEGRWFIRINEAEVEIKAVAVDKGEQFDAHKPAPVAKAKKEKADRGPTYKEIANRDRSVVLSPVNAVHAFLNKHGDNLKRKEAITQLVASGINYSTARTQYQRWFNGRKG